MNAVVVALLPSLGAGIVVGGATASLLVVPNMARDLKRSQYI